MTEAQGITCVVNGQEHTIAGDAGMPLLYALRDVLGLRSTRFGCGEGTCGACHVIVDGQVLASCDTPLSAVAGKQVETAESLDGEPPHPLVTAFLEHQAGQCGYCLAGIVMTAKALLEAEPDADRARVARALDGNLCRCGAHVRILDAIETAAAAMKKSLTR